MQDSQQTQPLPENYRPDGPFVGSVLRDRYRLDAELGRGGMGVVYRATDLELHRDVAVKVLSGILSGEEGRERMLREARATAALNHPHIVAVHDVGETDGKPFLVMEFVPGPRLSQARPHDLKRVVEIGAQICAALEHAHANSIIHRDLKPDNVLLSDSSEFSRVKLADLGLALPTKSARISRAGFIVGTASYMAPEQALGQPVDARTDLYALGVLLYELTTGHLPFKGDDPLTIISQHVHAPVVPPGVIRTDIPRKLDALIMRLLAKDPNHRYASATETKEGLSQALNEQDDVDDAAGSTVVILDALSRGRLVGRNAELAELRELWQRAREGRGHAVLISGEPGAGKSRLAREVTIQAQLDGALVLSGGCYEYEATTPYLPFVEAFRRLVREEKDDQKLKELLGDDAPQIAKLAPDIETRLGPFPKRHALAPHEERLLFFDAVAQIFTNIARRQSLLFYADDLHWADRGTLWLMGHLLRQLREERVLIVGAYRETELDRTHPLAKSLVDWNRERLITRVALKRFDATETTAQIDALLGEHVSGEFAEAVHRETEGNPFFVEEVLKALIEQGSVRRESGRWKRCELEQLVIPQSVKEAIGNRLDRVSQECNEVLRVSAVLGKVFAFEELTVTAQQSEEQLLDALDEAVGAQLIAAGGSDSFSFTHDKIREVLYEELNPIRRRRLHRLAAEGLEKNQRATFCAVERLAYHYIQAGDHERGLEFAKQAAKAAEKVFAFDEAIGAYARARDCAEALGMTDEQAEQEESIGKAYMLHGDTVAAGEHFEKALELATDPAVRVRLQCEAAASLVTNGDERGLEYLNAALEVLDPVNKPLETANALSTKARFHHLAGRHKKALELLMRAHELVAPTAEGDKVDSYAAPMIAQIYAYLAGANQHYGCFDDADYWAHRALEFGKRHDVLFAQATGYEYLGEDAVHKGEFRHGLGYAEKEIEIATRLHSRERRAWTLFYASQCHLHLSELDEAERNLTEGLALAETIGEQRAESLLKSNCAWFHAIQGRFEKAFTLANESLNKVSKNQIYLHFEALRCLASVHYLRALSETSKEADQDLADAERLCKQAEERVGPTESRVSQLWLGPLHMEVLLAQAKRAELKSDLPLAVQKRSDARDLLGPYQQLVSDCQSPRFKLEAERFEVRLNAP